MNVMSVDYRRAHRIASSAARARQSARAELAIAVVVAAWVVVLLSGYLVSVTR
jgi:hypothetical protein